jgi:AcrR family transcriptional regulator
MARTPKVVENRREQIIDAAINVFSQKGFNRTINQDIAREAGITPGLIYHYFENKNALLLAIAETLAYPPDTLSSSGYVGVASQPVLAAADHTSSGNR